MVIVELSNQAYNVAKNIKDFDKKDFDLFIERLMSKTIVGSDKIIQYLDMKERGLWKDGRILGESQ